MFAAQFLSKLLQISSPCSAAPGSLGHWRHVRNKILRISILSPGRSGLPDPNFNMINAFVQGLHELGSEGQNLAIERQYADGRSDRLREATAAYFIHASL
jgi:hypothetical protein